jgi:predicted exporter
MRVRAACTSGSPYPPRRRLDRVRPAISLALGTLLAVAGFLWALLHVGILLIADKPNEPRQYALEVGAAWGLLLLGVLAMAGGAWLARAGWRGRAH